MNEFKGMGMAYLIGRDWRMRLFPTTTARWVLCVKEAWPSGHANGNLSRTKRRELRRQAKKVYRQRYGNPLIWMFLLEIVIKAIIWWLQSRDS